MSEPAFREVSKEAFKEMYFRFGIGPDSGWTAEYWEEFERGLQPGWKFKVRDQESAAHDQMWIVTDGEAREHRLFFWTEDTTERFFDHPGKE